MMLIFAGFVTLVNFVRNLPPGFKDSGFQDEFLTKGTTITKLTRVFSSFSELTSWVNHD